MNKAYNRWRSERMYLPCAQLMQV